MTKEELDDRVADEVRDEIEQADPQEEEIDGGETIDDREGFGEDDFEESVAEEVGDAPDKKYGELSPEDFEAAIQAGLAEEEANTPPLLPSGDFDHDKAKAEAEVAAIAKAAELTRKQEEEAQAEAARVEAQLLAVNVAAAEAAEAKKARQRAMNLARQKKFQTAKAEALNEQYRAEMVNRPVEFELKRFQNFPAHIAAHAILAAVMGDSYDSFHDNEFQQQADGSVRCSLKLRSGGHERIFVHVPDEVKLAVVAVMSRASIPPEDQEKVMAQLKAAKTAEEAHAADLAEAELLSKMNADEQKHYLAQKRTLQAA